MPRLELRFFGTPSLDRDGRPVKLDRRKAEALLSYLVIEARVHRRSELAVLLWPEQSSARGKAALRRALFALTEALGRDWLVSDRLTVALTRTPNGSFWSDVEEFEALLAPARSHPHGSRRACSRCAEGLENAAALHGGDFLSGLTLRDAPGFDEWQHRKAERFRELRAEALEALVRFHCERGAHRDALVSAREWVRQDPLDETSHELLMSLLLASGKRSAALRLFDVYERRLESELGIEPPRSMAKLLRDARAPGFGISEGSGPEPKRPGGSAVGPFLERPDAALLDDVGSRVATDFDAVLAAWRWACRHRAVSSIDGALDPLHAFLDRKGLYREGIELLELALGAAEEGPLLGRLMARQGVLYSCIGRLEKARALIVAGLRAARAGECETEVAFCQNRLGYVLFAQGKYSRARALLSGSVSRYRESPGGAGLPWALNVWGHLSIGTKKARPILAESLERGREARDALRIASTLNSLGKEALVRHDFTVAERELQQSLELRREQGHRIGIADTLNNLGRTFLGLRRTDAARRVFDEALGVARGIDARPLLAEVLLGMAELHGSRDERERAVELASGALHLPGGWRDVKDRAASRLIELSRDLSPRVAAGAIAKGKHLEELA